MTIQERADALVQKIKHLIITNSGRRADDASTEEFFQAFCTAFREEIMVNWTATLDTIESKRPRVTYLVSMEYLPGRLLGNNITNVGATELVKAVLTKMNRNFDEIAASESDAGLGNGGLGRLSSCFLDSLATLQYPARAYGLRYQYGIFEQEIWGGEQIERPDCWLLNANPWETRRDPYAVGVHFRGQPIHAKNKHGDDVYLLENFEEVRALPYDTPIIGYSGKNDYSVLTLRLWSTKESPRNFMLQRYNAGFLDQAAENTTLTDVLYPNDNHELGKRIRLKQQFLLVSASLQDILRRHLRVYGDLSLFADKVRIQINDTHPALMVAEIVRVLSKSYDFSFQEAFDAARTVCSYTNHTILKEALEEWNALRMQELIPRQYEIIQRINWDFCNQVRRQFPNDEKKVQRVSIIEEGQVRMAHLAAACCHKINGVAELHTDILKKSVFKDFHEIFPEKIINVTNGVTQRRWLLHANPSLAEFISKRIGNEWITDFSQMARLAPFASDPLSQEEFWQIRNKNKEALITFLKQESPERDAKGKILCHSHALGVDALFDVQIKRFHEYKRQLMKALHIIMLYQEIKANPSHPTLPRLCIFSGKAAPGYKRAKQIIRLITTISHKLQKDPDVQNRLSVAFIENYSVSKAEIIIPAADLSEQISTAGWEASGTGNMKLAMNGALTIGTEDGANIEMRQAVTDAWWPFRFGSTAEENQAPHRGWDVYLQDAQIKQAVDALKDGTLAQTSAEEIAFAEIHTDLLEHDIFRVLKDLRSYSEMQKKVETLFSQKNAWAEIAIHNIAAMGRFSTDESIRRYAKNIWNVDPCPTDPAILAKVREEYSEHDRCRIKNGS